MTDSDHHLLTVRNDSNEPVLVGDRRLFPGQRRRVHEAIYTRAKAKYPDLTCLDQVKAEAENKPDDLTEISGLGKKRAEALHQLGISTFADLAQAEAEFLDQNIPNLTLAQAQGWIEQAQALVEA